tara:strand:+ start:1349 stop:2530 length:1182 start_codon:yes stop_codon:yes gene_type:complete
MDSLSGKQVKDLKELYSSIYEVEQPAEESNNEVDFEKYFESLSEEKKKNFFQRAFDKFMQGPDYGNKREKEKNKKIDKQVDDYVEKNKGNKPINKVNVDDETSGSAVLTKKNDTTNNDSTSNTDNSDTKNKVNNDFKNTSLYKTSANNPDNFKDKQSQKDYLKLLNDPNVNPAEIDGTKYFNDKINKIDTKVKVNKPETEIKKNEVKKKEKPLLSTKLPDTTKLGSTIKPVKPSSARDKMIAKNEIKLGTDRITNLRNKNADFQAMKKGDISKMDFMKQYPGSQTTKKYNLKQIKLGKPIIKSHYEPYDLVLDYVLSEGHAETVEEAHYVMTQMDADTIQGIVEMKGGSPYIINQADVNASTEAFKNYQKGMKNKITGEDLYKLAPGVKLPKV